MAQSKPYDALIEQELAKGEVAGLSVAIIEKGNIVHMEGYGLADVKKKRPVTPSTPFMIGSVTKQFTAMGVLILVEEGKIELDENVRTYLPDLTPSYDAVTVRHLLSHTSGIKSDFKKRSKVPFFNESLLGEELYNALSETELEFVPGEKLSYSNTGYSLLYMMIEAVSGTSYSAFLKTRIFDPLGMDATTVRDHDNSEIEGLAVGYYLRKGKFREANPVLRSGGGSMVSSAEDMARWDAALYTEKLVSREMLEQAWTPYVLNNGEVANMGMDPQGRYYQPGFGWFLGSETGRNLVHHSGGVDGYAANIDRYLDGNLTVIVLCNIENTTAVTLTSALAAEYSKQLR